MLEYIIFALSLAALLYSAKLITDSAIHFARVLGASDFIVGATVVALGTSLPELSSSIEAMHAGLPGIVIGNVIGSNIANIALVLGITSIFYIIKTKRNILKKDIPFLFISAFATAIVLIDFKITLIEGIMLLATYLAYLAYSIKIHKDHDKHKKTKLKPSSILLFFIGVAGIIYAAKYLISSSTLIMHSFGISEAIIGFILIAIGTSLPELATSIVAARKGKTDLMIGDIIGSNTFNSLVVLGASSTIGTVSASSSFITAALPSMLLLTLFLAYVVYDKKITKLEGATLLTLYIIILAVIL
ncbi:MAG: calcium/sodium antiporter [Candidatus Aenigmarchaeota archaeon]|nr:calcium/sodium antiporter [Candidatus Aenigmarchaeota archaeon]